MAYTSLKEIIDQWVLTMTDEQLVQLVTGFRRGYLDIRKSDGDCLELCEKLKSTLMNYFGIEAMLIEVDLGDEPSTFASNHFWLRLPDGRALDSTIDQFNDASRKFPEVYLGEPIEGIHFTQKEGN